MAQKTAAQILNEINTLLADNSQGDISAEDVRSVLIDIKDSFVNLADAGITTAEAGFLAGVTSAIQAQIDGKQDELTGLTASVTELNYSDGVTSAIQSQIDGKLSNSGGTLTGNLFMNNNLPAYYLIESDGNPDFDRVLINLASGQFRISTRDSDNTPISNDYTIDRDANGATRHSFKIADSNVLRVDSNGIDINGLDISNARSITQSKSASGNGVDLTHSGTGNALQVTKTNSGEAVDVVSGTVRIQSLTADRWLFIDSNNRVTVKTNAELLTAIGAITEVSDDTTPQLGGDLDAQSNDINNVASLGATLITTGDLEVTSGATGVFTTADGKEVTVTAGIITSIV